jgi:hypothetical protein
MIKKIIISESMYSLTTEKMLKFLANKHTRPGLPILPFLVHFVYFPCVDEAFYVPKRGNMFGNMASRGIY